MKWERADYDTDPVTLAKKLIGAVLCCRTKEGLTTGRIVECEPMADAGAAMKTMARILPRASPRDEGDLWRAGHATCISFMACIPVLISSASQREYLAASLSAPSSRFPAWSLCGIDGKGRRADFSQEGPAA